MQRARTTLSYVTCRALQYFSIISHKWLDFWQIFLNIKCVFLFSLQILSATCFILRRSERDMKKEYYDLTKYVLLFSDFNKALMSSIYILKILKYEFSWKSFQGKQNSMPTDRHDEDNSRFSQFCERAWNGEVRIRQHARTLFCCTYSSELYECRCYVCRASSACIVRRYH